MVEQRLNADTSDHVGPWRPCSCDQLARYAGRRSKTLATVLGPITLSRAYYHCAACQRGFCPRDHALGVEATSLSPAVTRMVGSVAAMGSFAESSDLLNELAGVPNPKHVERAAEALGGEMAADERQVIEPSVPSASTMYPGAGWHRGPHATVGAESPQREATRWNSQDT